MLYATSLKELARLLNLAPSTVSKALKGHPDISEATQNRVREMAKKVHYRPSALAKGLRDRRSYLIALIVPTLNDYFYVQVLRGILKGAYAREYKMIVFETHEQFDREAEICFSLPKSGVDGLLIAPSKTTQDVRPLKALKQNGLPFVFFDRILGDIDADRVLGDDFQGAYQVVSHLIVSGCKHIAMFSSSQHWIWAQKRQLGYMQSLQDHHITVDRQLIVEVDKMAEVRPLVNDLISRHDIDGIFACQDRMAIEVMDELQKKGFPIPGNVAVCGFGNDPSARIVSPALTTVDRKGLEMGKIAVDLLIDRIENQGKKDTRTVLLKNELIIRDSSLVY